MSRLAGAYDLGRHSGVCAATGRALRPGDAIITALAEAPDAERANAGTPFGLFLHRADFAADAWDAGARPQGLLYFWRTTVPESGQARRILVDDETLLDLLIRLESDVRPSRVAFRFVLGLLLVRRKLLRVVGQRHESTADGEREIWLVLPKGSDPAAPSIALVNPRLREEDVCAIAEELGEIMQGHEA